VQDIRQRTITDSQVKIGCGHAYTWASGGHVAEQGSDTEATGGVELDGSQLQHRLPDLIKFLVTTQQCRWRVDRDGPTPCERRRRGGHGAVDLVPEVGVKLDAEVAIQHLGHEILQATES